MAGDQAELSRLLRELGLHGEPPALLEEALRALAKHGDLRAGLAHLDRLSAVRSTTVALDTDRPEVVIELPEPASSTVEDALRALGPWRKGPFSVSQLGGPSLLIDSEWRSDHKWQRITRLGASFEGKRVLDVGTGNGYFLLRLLGAGARHATGLEPSLRSILQFLAVRRLFSLSACALIPLRLEALPPAGLRYDTVMSMGVLYHQREPLDHLVRLCALLAPGGDLILETIVVPGSRNLLIEPGQRYAGMRNVYVVPTAESVLAWLSEAGAEIVQVGETVVTTSAEQRATTWAEGPSLSATLEPPAGDPDDPGRRTREGHPRPARLAVWARRRGVRS